MKIIPGLPLLPAGYWWEVNPSPSGSYYFVELIEEGEEPSLPRRVGVVPTRSWPRPTIRTIVRAAKVVHRRWLLQNDRRAAAFVGRVVGSPE
jgi:hypothetical protein